MSSIHLKKERSSCCNAFIRIERKPDYDELIDEDGIFLQNIPAINDYYFCSKCNFFLKSHSYSGVLLELL